MRVCAYLFTFLADHGLVSEDGDQWGGRGSEVVVRKEVHEEKVAPGVFPTVAHPHSRRCSTARKSHRRAIVFWHGWNDTIDCYKLSDCP